MPNETSPTETTLSNIDLQVSFPNSMEILQDPNIWVLNTAVMVGITQHTTGAINNTLNGEQSVISNSARVKSDKMADYPVTICDKQGVALYDAMIICIQIQEAAPYNLYPGFKHWNDGWTIISSKSKGGVTYTSPDGKNTLTFDIQVDSPEGVLF